MPPSLHHESPGMCTITFIHGTHIALKHHEFHLYQILMALIKYAKGRKPQRDGKF